MVKKKARASAIAQTTRVLSKCKDFEIHITLDEDLFDDGSYYKRKFPDWKHSKIDGDPILGKGTRYYLTTHRRTLADAKAALSTFSDILTLFGYNVIRQKIEAIIYDTKKKLAPRKRG